MESCIELRIGTSVTLLIERIREREREMWAREDSVAVLFLQTNKKNLAALPVL